MRIEISHDILAQYIYEKASADAKLRLKMKAFVAERYKYFLETKELLSSKDLDYISPYQNYLTTVISEPEHVFIANSKKHVKYQRNKYWIFITIAGSAAFVAAISWGVYQLKNKQKIAQINNTLNATLYNLEKSHEEIVRKNEEITKQNEAIDSLFKSLGQMGNKLNVTAEQLLKREQEAQILTEQLKKANTELTSTIAQLNKANEQLKFRNTELNKNLNNSTSNVKSLKMEQNSLKATNKKLLTIVEGQLIGNKNSKKEAFKAVVEVLKYDTNNESAQNILRTMYKQETQVPDFSIPPIKNIINELEKKFK